ncbi:MAG: hypothetical protein JNK02_16720 [Planctomycetes bacterium]|nr:hypothetical protein [Planctomycetota bacterium]
MSKSSTLWLALCVLAVGTAVGWHALRRSDSPAPGPVNPTSSVAERAEHPPPIDAPVPLLAPSDDRSPGLGRAVGSAPAPALSAPANVGPESKYAAATQTELEAALRETRVRFERRTKAVIAERRARGEATEVTAGPDGAFPTGNDGWPGGVRPLAGSIRGSSGRPGVAQLVQLLPGEDPESDELAAEVDWLQRRIHELGESAG